MSQQINLLNAAFVKHPSYFSLPSILQALGLIVVGTLCFYGYALYQVGQLEKQSVESTKHYNDELMRLGKLSAEFSTQQNTQLLQEEARKLDKKVGDQNELIDTLKSGALGNTTGFSEYMRAFARQIVQGLWLTGFKIDSTQISLSGNVISPELLPLYIQRLGRESVMQGKAFSNLQMRQSKAEQGARYVEFTLQSSPDSEEKK